MDTRFAANDAEKRVFFVESALSGAARLLYNYILCVTRTGAE